jgi:aromatic-L-amino-acid decarboxylase
MPDLPPRHMTPDEFRRAAALAAEWIATYHEHISDFPVASHVASGEIRAKLPPHPPESGEPFDAVVRDLDAIVLPGITHWQSPTFFGYFPANASLPAALGDFISSGLGVQGMLWATSPACTELETHVLDWLVELLDLPPAFRSSSTGGGVLQDTASSATLCAMIAARERASEFAVNRRGVDRTFTAYASTQAHSSVEKAARIAGVGAENLRLVPVDEGFALQPERLDAMIAEDRRAGRHPFFVCATVGTTSSTAIDPVRTIGEICRRHDLWLHVDAAYAGTAALCPEHRWIHDGLELADSYCFNPHKWMLTNFDCDAFYVADRAALINALSILPEYLRNRATESGAVFDYRDWQVPLGRRFRALKLWFVIRHYGAEGLRRHVRHHIVLARDLASWIAADPDFEVAAPHPLTLICFRHRRGDAFTERLMHALNERGRLFLTHTKLGDRFVLRMAIGGAYTERQHVEAAWDEVRDAARALAGHRP